MAGMLPGVEAARRRKFHKSYGSELSSITSVSSNRRPSFCLYAPSHEFLSNSSMQRNSISHKGLCDESRLGAAAREAKKRLDQRLQRQWASQIKRNSNGQHRLRSSGHMPTVQSDSQAQIPQFKKNGSKLKMSWLKLSWKSSEQEDCAVCLEPFKGGRGGTLMQLPCAHRFHTNCLVPWLEANAHCPCCRMAIHS